MGSDSWVDPHPGLPSGSKHPSGTFELGMPNSLAEPATGTGKCTRCGEVKLLDQDGMIMWHPSKEIHSQRYNDESDKRRGCLGTGLPAAL